MKLGILFLALASGFAQAQPANMNRGVTSDALDSLNRYMEAKKNKKPDENTVQIVKVISSTNRVEGQGQKCAEGEVKPNPVIVTSLVGFDASGKARVTDSGMEIQDCGGVAAPAASSVHFIAADRKTVAQDQLSEQQRSQLRELLRSLEGADKSLTLKVSAEGKIESM